MGTKRKNYVLGGAEEIQAVIRALAEKYSVVTAEKLSWRTDYLDTFDWRIWRHGDVLEYREHRQKGRFVWRHIDHHQVMAEFPVDSCPLFIGDLPGWLRPEPLLEMTKPRRIFPQAYSRSQSQQYDIVDKHQKVVVRLSLVKETRRLANNRSGEVLPLRLLVEALRGFEKVYAKILELLAPLGLEEYTKDPLLHLLQLSGRRPCDYTRRLRYVFKPDDRADHVSKKMLLQLLDVIQANEAGVCEDLDTEFLNDMRHSIKAAHSLVSQLDGILPADTLWQFNEDLLWLEQETQLLLHLNNWLLNFSEYQALLSKKYHPVLQGLMDWLRSQRQAELIRVVAVLRSGHYVRLIKRWRVFLESDVSNNRIPDDADRPVSRVVGRQVWRVYRQLCRYPEKQLTNTNRLAGLVTDARVLNDLLAFSRVLYKSGISHRLTRNVHAFLTAARHCQQRQRHIEALDQFVQIMQDDGLMDKALATAIARLREALVMQCEGMHADLLVAHRVLVDDATRKRFKRLLKKAKS